MPQQETGYRKYLQNPSPSPPPTVHQSKRLGTQNESRRIGKEPKQSVNLDVRSANKPEAQDWRERTPQSRPRARASSLRLAFVKTAKRRARARGAHSKRRMNRFGRLMQREMMMEKGKTADVFANLVRVRDETRCISE